MSHRRRRVPVRHGTSPASALPLDLAFGDPASAMTLSAQAATLPSVRSKASVHPHQSWQSLVWESAFGIMVNIVITGAALNGVVRLLPLQLTQHNRLHLLKKDVHQLHQRVSQLRSQFDRSMDPLQTQALIKERENYVPANQLQLQLVPPQTMTGMHSGE